MDSFREGIKINEKEDPNTFSSIVFDKPNRIVSPIDNNSNGNV